MENSNEEDWIARSLALVLNDILMKSNERTELVWFMEMFRKDT